MVTEACVPLVSFRFTSALVLNAKKKKKKKSGIEKGEEGERQIGKGSEEE